jgi:DNA-binding CsgD family transcriptional regulator
MQADLIDRIYECSFVPELWPDVLDELAVLTDARGAQLFAVREKTMNWTTSASLTETFQAYMDEGWFGQCTRRICLFSNNAPSFLVEHDFWTDQQLDENPIYRNFFRPRGLGWSASTGLAMPTRDNIVFTVERDYQRGPMEKERVAVLNELRPHLARASFIAARLSLKNAQTANNTLAVLGLPALILDEGGVVVEANALMSDLSEHVQWRGENRVALTDPKANEQLWAALPSLEARGDMPVHSFPLKGVDGRAALVAHIVPIRRSAMDIFGHAYSLLIATPVAARKAPPVELLRSLFDLTPSEARVARGLAVGDSIDDIAANGDVSRNTVRTQLQQILGKMGCTRQAEVTALLASVALVTDATPVSSELQK